MAVDRTDGLGFGRRSWMKENPPCGSFLHGSWVSTGFVGGAVTFELVAQAV